MKKSISFTACLLLIGLCLSAQTPQAFKYQAVARNSSGDLIQNQLVAFRISILQGGPSGTLVYQESHAPTTNAYGLANLEIGQGTVLSGTFGSINWSAGQMYMKVELDPAGGTSYQDMGTSKLLSVPYSLFSERSGNTYWGKNANSIFYNEGPVGIGTSNPTARLDVRGNNPDDGAMIKVGNGDLSHFMMLSGGRMTDPNPMLFWKDGDPLRFVTDQGGGSEKMRIMSDGRVAIGTSSPESSALMDMTSTSKGLLIPRMTQIQRNAIVSPSNGLLVYQTDNTPGYYYNSGSSSSPAWMLLGASFINGWSLTGNAGIDPAVNFLGTTDNKPLKFRVNNLKAGEINPVNDNTFVGRQAGENSTGSTNVAFGAYALQSNVANLRSTAIGCGAMYYADNTTTGVETYNTAVGCEALRGSNTPADNTGRRNTAIGDQSMYSNSAGFHNTALGNEAMFYNTTGNYNTVAGLRALYSNKANSRSTAVGYQAMYYADDRTTGRETYNTAVGYEALKGSVTPGNNTGQENTAMGDQALSSNSAGYGNSAVGNKALYSNTTGSYNTANGDFALVSNTEGSANTAIGEEALSNNVAGSRGTAVGYRSMYNTYNSITPFDNFNVAFGFRALYGSPNPSANTGNENTAIGYEALFNNSTGSMNTATGNNALYSNISGAWNTANGFQSLYCNTGGYMNTAIGHKALFFNTTGSYNTATGYAALFEDTTGVGNTANGWYALSDNQSGNENTAVGYLALTNNHIGNYNTAVGALANYYVHSDYNTAVGWSAGDSFLFSSGTFLGSSATTNADGYNNCMALGYDAQVTASNRVVIGNSSVSSIGGYVGWTNFSDGRFKKNISEQVPGLAFIKLLRPVIYTLDISSLNAQLGKNKPATLREEETRHEPSAEDLAGIAAKEKISYTGFIGQEVEAAAKSIGYDFSGVDAPQSENGYYGLRYAEFVVPLVKAVQELARENEELKERISRLESLNK